MNILSQDIKYMQGVGPNRATLLANELHITTVGDLLVYYPYKYVDRSRIYKIGNINGNMPYVQLCGQILSFETTGEGRGARLIAHFSDGTGFIDLVWFQGIKYIKKTYDCHKSYIVFGKPNVFNGRIQIAHPEMENAPEEIKQQACTTGNLFQENPTNTNIQESLDAQPSVFKGLCPSYNTSEKMKRSGLTSAGMAKLTANMFKILKTPLPETLPGYIVQKHHLMSHNDAIHNIHYPSSPESLRHAQLRLKFEELFYVQLNILRYVKDRQLRYKGMVFNTIGENFNRFFYHHLPFQLTEAQKRVIREIRADMRSQRQMNRLLQGDVGSGKTLVALMIALIAIDNGCQACIMAPTEILAEQHRETLCGFLADLPVRVELLTGTVKGKKRTAILEGLVTGDIDILVGTHAVIEDNVLFHKLGIVVIDEQHRFGVAQRAKLWSKSNTPPHILVMTATPIPRTLAMTLYGDLDVSVIDELPPGRKPIKTVHQFDNRRHSLYESIRKQIEEGRQIYIVYPLIKESEKIDIKNLEEGYEHVCEEFPQYKVSVVHGKMKPGDKEEEMQKFVTGETQIMVATTVIEVGVNVPNASVMVIQNAERFGLSQLHQLRGRVGRGADQSYCILVTGFKLSEETRKRIQIMCETNDGFEIAEADLKLRGPGDLEGTQQSGVAFDLKIADIARDGQIVQLARDEAQKIIDNDPLCQKSEYSMLWNRLSMLRKTNINWSAIS